MALILEKAWRGYVFLFHDSVDPRTQSWPLVAKPYQGIALLALYLMFVLKWGPQWMQDRRPFNLDKVLIIYNAIQVIGCMYLFGNALRLAWLRDYKWLCEPVDFSYSARALEIADLVYFFYMLKITDLLDTIFFVLRKKNNQVSFLHVYHHAGMVAIGWGVTTYLPGGHGTLIGVINALVHVVMYSYYLLTVATPSIKNIVWIKKFVTQLQIVQFFWCVMHMALIVFKPDCGYPRWTSAVILPQNLFMLVLFLDFYIKTYIKKPNKKPNGKVKLNTTKNANMHKDEINELKNDINKVNNVNNLKNNTNQIRKGINNSNEFDGNNNNCENDKNKIPYTNGKTKTNNHQK